MSTRELNALVTKALVDSQFRADILNGHRKERLQEFSLSSTEYRAVLSIKAESLDQFIHELADTMYTPAQAVGAHQTMMSQPFS